VDENSYGLFPYEGYGINRGRNLICRNLKLSRLRQQLWRRDNSSYSHGRSRAQRPHSPHTPFSSWGQFHSTKSRMNYGHMRRDYRNPHVAINSFNYLIPFAVRDKHDSWEPSTLSDNSHLRPRRRAIQLALVPNFSFCYVLTKTGTEGMSKCLTGMVNFVLQNRKFVFI
jgi:hypothetical protein